eukprot:5430740-Prymnesium_polylepis.1
MDAPHTRLECARTAGMFVYRTDFTVPTTVTVRRNLESGRLTADHISYAPVIYHSNIFSIVSKTGEAVLAPLSLQRYPCDLLLTEVPTPVKRPRLCATLQRCSRGAGPGRRCAATRASADCPSPAPRAGG